MSPHPFDLLVEASARRPAPDPGDEGAAPPPGGRTLREILGAGDAGRDQAVPAWRHRLAAARPRSLQGRTGWRRPAVPAPAAALAREMIARGPTIVAIGSRKGGVGKTSHAAGIAIAAGVALDAVGHRAAIVDANIANPDAWGQMNLPAGAATVREAVNALNRGGDPPEAVHSATPALACYPEIREASEYSRTEVGRLAGYLRRRYTFIVVDMSNRLPDPLAGPEAAVASHWLGQADVLVLPTAASRQDFNGVLDYLDVGDLPPVVVAYIVPSARRNRDHPVTREYVTAIRDRVEALVDVPDEADKVRLAGMDGVPVQSLSPRLRAAYQDLAAAVVRVPARGRAR